MTLEEYTPENICGAMGLPGFVDPVWGHRRASVIRVLFKPSFHPEACVTMEKRGAGLSLSVCALHPQGFWRKGGRPNPYLQKVHEQKEPLASSTEFKNFRDSLLHAALAFDRSRNFICLDGLGIDACLVIEGECQRFDGVSVITSELRDFLRSFVQLAWNECSDDQVRNSLAHILRYVGSDPPRSETARGRFLNVMVLGDQQERQDLLQAMQNRVRKGKRSG